MELMSSLQLLGLPCRSRSKLLSTFFHLLRLLVLYNLSDRLASMYCPTTLYRDCLSCVAQFTLGFCLPERASPSLPDFHLHINVHSSPHIDPWFLSVSDIAIPGAARVPVVSTPSPAAPCAAPVPSTSRHAHRFLVCHYRSTPLLTSHCPPLARLASLIFSHPVAVFLALPLSSITHNSILFLEAVSSPSSLLIVVSATILHVTSHPVLASLHRPSSPVSSSSCLALTSRSCSAVHTSAAPPFGSRYCMAH
ncbi:hypothetical protein C8R45DRAFT_1142879 [Mycena sanguinolenta]|nr:hypothetical protein C8R45DRAFT_1142879 [Mycena sanguinolenta]